MRKEKKRQKAFFNLVFSFTLSFLQDDMLQEAERLKPNPERIHLDVASQLSFIW